VGRRPSDHGFDVAGWSPDGARLLFWSEPLFSASLLADGTTLQSVPARDGASLLFARVVGERAELGLIGADGADPRTVVDRVSLAPGASARFRSGDLYQQRRELARRGEHGVVTRGQLAVAPAAPPGTLGVRREHPGGAFGRAVEVRPGWHRRGRVARLQPLLQRRERMVDQPVADPAGLLVGQVATQAG
jgi:hypothetical protein